MKHVAVIGAGLGGLSAAISLASKGFKVTVIEKNKHIGGKMMPIMTEGHRFDFGPNTITMPEVFQSVIAKSGADPDDYFQFEKLEAHTVNHFEDGRKLTFRPGREAMRTEVDRFTGGQLKKNDITGYMEEAQKLYDIANSRFFTNLDSYLDPKLWRDMLKVHPLKSMHKLHQKYFKDPALIQAFDRYATYIGSNPYEAPATFALIAHLELNDGVYFAKGGNTTIADGFAKRARELGVEFRLQEEATQIEVSDGLATHVELNHSEFLPVDYIVMNGDLLTQYPRLVAEADRPDFKNPVASQTPPSISAYVRCIGLNQRIEGLAHHNVYFSSDYEAESRALFKEHRYAGEPTIYISNSSVTDRSMGDAGDNLFLLVNAPATSSGSEIDFDAYDALIDRRLRRFGVDLSKAATDLRMTPSDMERKFSAYHGAIYGFASNDIQHAFLRPSNRSNNVHNLYFAGGSTHPGGGSPMVTLSGGLASERIIRAAAQGV
ncbi:phytoene desaturase family protein [Exiguobacterium flavidum]|uniref:phytoene desaturase family protein n=1 Tax=Exiguobacterium flavidum TaxID=2184695 RepID=UPI000DF7928F|nr:phytoene desaturase family protein [Exiguobacterium flavidum]